MTSEIISTFDDCKLLVEEMNELKLTISIMEYIKYWVSCHYTELQQYYINPSIYMSIQPEHRHFLEFVQLEIMNEIVQNIFHNNTVILRSGNVGYRFKLQINGLIYSIFEIEADIILNDCFIKMIENDMV